MSTPREADIVSASNLALVIFESLNDFNFVRLVLVSVQELPQANVSSSNDKASVANSFNVIVVLVLLLFNK